VVGKSTSTSDLQCVDNTQTLVKTQNLVSLAKKHYGCDTVQGVALEDDGGPSTAGSHWEKRTLMNEFMGGRPTGFANSKSAFSLALLHDSGWYTVNYSVADSLAWGYKYGCTSLDSCSGERGFCKS